MNLPIWVRREPSEADLRGANVPQSKWAAGLDKINPKLDYRKRIEEFIGAPEYKALRENLEKGTGLFLFGPYRSGKSSLAAVLVREVAAHHCNPYWLDALDMVARWEARDSRLMSAHLLVIDDIGMEGDHPYPKQVLGRILRYRLERLMSTVMTSNTTPSALEKAYGSKLKSLMEEYLIPVPVTGMDWGGRKW